MIAAIYARKSTDQAVADEAKSVTRQIEHGREYATGKGWAVPDDLLFVDDGISGAEFARRPGFLRLMNALKPRPRFQVLVMSEESRLGRESIETAYALKQLVASGVRVFFYLEDRERTLDSPTDKIMLSLTAFADELEREKARQRVTDVMVRKARAGHVTGGRLFGYDNVDVQSADGSRSHVERRVNEVEAAVVRRIFEMCAAGNGYTRIAKTLNAERVPCPRPQRGRPAGWAPSSVNEILHRDTYRGVVVWNRTRKRDRWGQHRTAARPESEWLRRSVPGLRIVPDDIWNAAHVRLSGIRAHLMKATGGRIGARARDVESRYLLPGFARCGVCGGGLCVMSRDSGKTRRYVYGCLANHKRGKAVCDNALVVSMENVDREILRTLASDVLRPAVVDALVDGVAEALAPDARAAEAKRYQAELEAIHSEIARLTESLAAVGPIGAVVDAIKARQSRRDELITALASSEGTISTFDRAIVARTVRTKLEDWRRLLTSQVQDGRALLREVLTGPIVFRPENDHFRFEGRAAMDRLLAGIACNQNGVPTGIAARWLSESRRNRGVKLHHFGG